MFDIARLGKFHLAGGCHKETNANGDLCVNEAAILAAGFEHRAVRSADDCPPCFSRVISQYAIMLDDLMPDDLRNELLMPFVLRLAGTADSPEVERKRMRFIVVESVRRINSYVYRHILQHPEAAAQCEKVVLLCQAWWVAQRITRRFSRRYLIEGADSAAHAAYSAYATYARNVDVAYKNRDLVSDACAGDTYAMSVINAAICGPASAAARRAGARAQRAFFTMATDILDEAIKIGNHSEALTVVRAEAGTFARKARNAAHI